MVEVILAAGAVIAFVIMVLAALVSEVLGEDD